MKTFSFMLPDDEALTLDEAVATLMGNFPDLTRDDALKALVRIGFEEMPRRLSNAQGRPELYFGGASRD